MSYDAGRFWVGGHEVTVEVLHGKGRSVETAVYFDGGWRDVAMLVSRAMAGSL